MAYNKDSEVEKEIVGGRKMEMEFSLACAGSEGHLYEYPDLIPVGKTGDIIKPLTKQDLIPLPAGSSLAMLPGRAALGADRQGRLRQASYLPHVKGPLFSVSALLPMGYARTYLPAAKARLDAQPLPLFGYTAVGFLGGQLYAAAIRVEPDNTTWDPKRYNTSDLKGRVLTRCQQYPKNRILHHLARCALEYGCFTAQNLFYRRWEGGIPVSPACNARCLGCISKQISECCPSPQERINFIPSVQEVVDIAVPHLNEAEDSIISFGQGCEGEPTLMADLLVQAIGGIRKRTNRGIININTNGSRPNVIQALAHLGLNSIRVSLISPQPKIFNAYVRPRAYTLDKVKETIRIAVKEGLTVSLNYLIFPGVSDREEEVDTMVEFLRSCPVHLVQLRNLNIDPDVYLKIIPRRRGRLLGIRGLCERLQAEFPDMLLGSFTHSQ